jgi:hypothetical protein
MNLYNFEIYQGDKFSSGVNVKGDDGLPMDLTGYSIRGYIRATYSSSVIEELNGVIVNATEGALEISLSSAETSALPATQLIYDIEAFSAEEDDVFKILCGYINVYPEVTYA